ncbi:alpha,alpha-trehalose-phosphate synthase (UDP-forming) [Halogeometricum luteum]|uniref:Trehalose-6-phosphate synthase n=1 Tax=Halogeometricum luteum TaxID=2950537 RepID=A0ABU2G0P1_9EURY|nr:trehalose-6-phosphate synthase [Halogeometricum sp. S3BR5-2]MDS0293814.1 trehalose-6-phosphate synthase [Halogeometricum sp. S3BR5-2]
MTGADDSTDAPNGDGDEETPSVPGDLVVVSNRQPYSHEYDDEGNVVVDEPAGGLTAGLDPVMQRVHGTWIAWGDGEADREVTGEDDVVRMPPEEESYDLKRIWLSDDEVEAYYYGYSNRVLWPLSHGGIWKTEYANRHWRRYQQVNGRFADAVVDAIDEDSVVWFQDYHFALAPRMVREEAPDALLTHFWHITWPGWDTFRACPQADDLLDGLLANDVLGFHVERYCQNFLDCVDQAFEDAFVDYDDNRVQYEGHTTYVRAFPLGVDADGIAESASSADEESWRAFKRDRGIPEESKVALGVDRLDYTKGIVERLKALEQFWKGRPERQGELTYVQKADESRSLIPEYQNLQTNVDEAVERINERFGTDEWTPVVYIDDWLESDELNALYRYSDVMLVSALRDGMNLVAKEYVASQVDDDGVLVLSDQTGAYEQLGEHSLVVNPHDTERFARTIEEAMTMDAEERRERMSALREGVHDEDLNAWMVDVFAAAEEAGERRTDADRQ